LNIGYLTSIIHSPIIHAMKRASDFVLSLLLIFIALPLWAIGAIAIKLDSPGPAFYRALRIGKTGDPIAGSLLS